MNMGQTRLVAATLLLALLPGCKVRGRTGYYEDQKKSALAALQVLHDRFSAGDFEAIYESTTGPLHARPKAELVAAMRQTYSTWGKVIKAEVKSSSCFPGEVRFVVQGRFEKGEAGEMVVWAFPDDTAHLAHFQIFPGQVDVPAGASNECQSTR
jgi:hypothetical protein